VWKLLVLPTIAAGLIIYAAHSYQPECIRCHTLRTESPQYLGKIASLPSTLMHSRATYVAEVSVLGFSENFNVRTNNDRLRSCGTDFNKFQECIGTNIRFIQTNDANCQSIFVPNRGLTSLEERCNIRPMVAVATIVFVVFFCLSWAWAKMERDIEKRTSSGVK
jgi:hypothetical protein